MPVLAPHPIPCLLVTHSWLRDSQSQLYLPHVSVAAGYIIARPTSTPPPPFPLRPYLVSLLHLVTRSWLRESQSQLHLEHVSVAAGYIIARPSPPPHPPLLASASAPVSCLCRSWLHHSHTQPPPPPPQPHSPPPPLSHVCVVVGYVIVPVPPSTCLCRSWLHHSHTQRPPPPSSRPYLVSLSHLVTHSWLRDSQSQLHLQHVSVAAGYIIASPLPPPPPQPPLLLYALISCICRSWLHHSQSKLPHLVSLSHLDTHIWLRDSQISALLLFVCHSSWNHPSPISVISVTVG